MTAPIADTILFASDELLVRRVAGGRGGTCFVTFDSYTDVPHLDRPGFGEGYFRSRGIDAVHVLSRVNRWYQHAVLDAALAAAAAATAGYDQVIAYGSSMGGFAALHYGARCGAGVGIALSPQYSVDPALAPFEDRWLSDARAIAFRDEVTTPLERQYVVYDPYDVLDRRHAALFAARSPTLEVRIPYAGHPVGSYLVETRCFEPLLDGVMQGELDISALEAELRRCRRLSGQYLYTLAFRTPDRRRQQRLALARAAVAANPSDPSYLSYLAAALDTIGAHDEAGETHRQAVAMAKDSLHIHHNLLLHHEAVGDLIAARGLADRLMAAHPGRPMLRQSVARIRAALRREHRGGRLAQRLRLDRLLDAMLIRRLERRGTAP